MLDSITPYFTLYYILPALGVIAALSFRKQSLTLSSAPKKTTTSTSQTPEMTHTVVILGAGFVGVATAHHLLKHTPDAVGLRVILVAPNDALFWNVASPRGFLPVGDTVSPKGSPGFGNDKLFYPLAPQFKHYGTRFEQIVGRATSLDPDAQTVEVAAGEKVTVTYDTLLIATGSDIVGGVPFKILSTGGTAETKAALEKYRSGVKAARHIVVAGGGMTGVELAGELGHAYGKSHTKKIVLVVGEAAPLVAYGTKASVQQQAESQLKALGVEVITNARVLGVQQTQEKTVLNLQGHGDIETDLYIPAFGSTFNTQFIPEKLLDVSAAGRRRVRTRATLQAAGYDNIFVAGDAANLQAPSLKNADDQVQVLSRQLQLHLGSQKADQEHKFNEGVVMAVSIGPGGGTGQFGNWRLFSFLLWLLKARFLGTDYAGDVAAGRRTVGNTKW